jgi:hypothetical protein
MVVIHCCQAAMTSGAAAHGHWIENSVSEGAGCVAKAIDVTIPKLPRPPRPGRRA